MFFFFRIAVFFRIEYAVSATVLAMGWLVAAGIVPIFDDIGASAISALDARLDHRSRFWFERSIAEYRVLKLDSFLLVEPPEENFGDLLVLEEMMIPASSAIANSADGESLPSGSDRAVKAYRRLAEWIVDERAPISAAA